MIVRVSGEDQYRMDAAERERLNELDNAVADAVRAGDEAAFRSTYDALLEFVRARGERVADEEIESSDLILPPADLSLGEASAEFTGDGLIPG
jgi:PspA-Associated protein